MIIYRRAIRYNILVNPSGKPYAFRAVDWIEELLNLLIKVIYGGDGSNFIKDRILLESVLVLLYRSSHENMERNFALVGLTTMHADKDMHATFEPLLKTLLENEVSPNSYKAKRKSNYVIPDALIKGTSIIEREGGKQRRQTEEGENGEEEREEEEEERDETELTIDDISMDGF